MGQNRYPDIFATSKRHLFTICIEIHKCLFAIIYYIIIVSTIHTNPHRINHNINSGSPKAVQFKSKLFQKLLKWKLTVVRLISGFARFSCCSTL